MARPNNIEFGLDFQSQFLPTRPENIFYVG